MGKLRDLRNRADSELYKKVGILFVLFLASCVSTFGIYNTFGPNLISMIGALPSVVEQVANVAILGLFGYTLFYLNITSNIKKTAGEKMRVFGLIILTVGAIAGLMVVTGSVIYPLISMAVVSITFYLYRLMMATIEIYGVFALLAIFIAVPVVFYTNGWVSNGSVLFTILQIIMTIVVFIGATAPRIKQILFKTRTTDNVELDHGAGQEDSES